MIFFRLLGRLIVIAFGFFLASLAAALTATAGLDRAYGFTTATGDPFGDFVTVWVLSVLVSAMAISQFSLALAGIVIVVTESFALRSWLYYAAAGAVMGVLALVTLETEHGRAMSSRMADFEALIFVAAGLVAGLVYWLIAGRNAGAVTLPLFRARAGSDDGNGPAGQSGRGGAS